MQRYMHEMVKSRMNNIQADRISTKKVEKPVGYPYSGAENYSRLKGPVEVDDW